MPEEKARQFAEKIGAIFKLTSAYTSVGIEELFVSLGSKFIDPKFKDDGTHKPNARAVDDTFSPPPISEPQKEVQQQNSGQNVVNDNTRNQSIKLDLKKAKEKKKKKFC